MAYRRLCHMAFSPTLERFASASRRNLVKDMDRYQAHGDHGASYFVKNAALNYAMSVPRLRSDVASYLAYSSVKLRYLSWILLHVVITGKRRLLIFARWPMLGWIVEIFLLNLALNVSSLCSIHLEEERTRKITRFNDSSSTVEVLVTTYATCALGVNLHKSCADLVMLQPAVNANTALQTIGRIHRLGQSRKQNV